MNAIASAPNFATEEELWQLSQDGHRFELINGELKTMALTGGEHGGYTIDLETEVNAFVRRRRLGRCFGAETGFLVHQNPKPFWLPISPLSLRRTFRIRFRKSLFPLFPTSFSKCVRPVTRRVKWPTKSRAGWAPEHKSCGNSTRAPRNFRLFVPIRPRWNWAKATC